MKTKNIIRIGIIAFVFFNMAIFVQAQCGFGPGKGCPNTDYENAFINSNNDASTIEYDNYTSSYHGTAVRQYDGVFKVWGQNMNNLGTATTSGHALSPLALNGTNFPALGTAEVYKVTGASSGGNRQQFVALASNGLYAWGEPGYLLSTTIKSTNVFAKITVAGKADGLPVGVTPSDVKMMTGTARRIDADTREGTLCIVTCSGDVWVLSGNTNMRGNGATGNANTWYRVQETATTNLTNVIVARVSGGTAMALKADGTLWTWGNTTYLGNNTAPMARSRATNMPLTGISGTIKMIGVSASTNGSTAEPSAYFMLMTDGNLYSMGYNMYRQLGDWTQSERRGWVQPRYNSTTGPVMNNIKWISPNEHDGRYTAINVINNSNQLYNFGYSAGYMLGRGDNVAVNPGIPSGLTASSVVTSVHTGGHTTMITEQCQSNYGYVGHRISGSMGNGSDADTDETSFTYNTAYVPVCGSEVPNVTLTPEILSPTGTFCTSVSYNVNVTPAGGTLTATGPATISGNSTSGYTIIFNSAGSGNLTYQAPAGTCAVAPAPVSVPYSVTACSSDLRVIKSASNNNPEVGSQITFTIEATNLGTSGNGNVIVTDVLPSGYTYVSDNPSVGSYDPITGAWDIGLLEANQSETLEITVTVNSTGNFTNTATITGAVNDPTPGNNTASASVTICNAGTNQVILNSNQLSNSTSN